MRRIDNLNIQYKSNTNENYIVFDVIFDSSDMAERVVKKINEYWTCSRLDMPLKELLYYFDIFPCEFGESARQKMMDCFGGGMVGPNGISARIINDCVTQIKCIAMVPSYNTGVLVDFPKEPESTKVLDHQTVVNASKRPKNWDDICKGMYITIDSNRQYEDQFAHTNHFVNGCSGRHPYGKEETNMSTSNTYNVMTESDMQKLHVLTCKTALYDLGIRKIIFNDNATIVFWVNNTKTVVKCCEMDTYSREAAIAIAIMKHRVGEDNYHYVMDTLLGKKGDHFEYSVVSRIPTSIDIIDMNKEEK